MRRKNERLTDDEKIVYDLASSLAEDEEPRAVSLHQLKQLVTQELGPRFRPPEYLLTRAARSAGLVQVEDRVSIYNRKHTVLMNTPMKTKVADLEPKLRNRQLKEACLCFDKQEQLL